MRFGGGGGVPSWGGGSRKARMHKAGAPGEGGREQRQPEGAGRGKGRRRRVEARKTAASQQPCLIRVCCRAWPDPWRMWECERGGWEGPGDLLPVPNGGCGAGWPRHSLLSAPQISLRWESFFQPLTDNLDPGVAGGGGRGGTRKVAEKGPCRSPADVRPPPPGGPFHRWAHQHARCLDGCLSAHPPRPHSPARGLLRLLGLGLLRGVRQRGL